MGSHSTVNCVRHQCCTMLQCAQYDVCRGPIVLAYSKNIQNKNWNAVWAMAGVTFPKTITVTG